MGFVLGIDLSAGSGNGWEQIVKLDGVFLSGVTVEGLDSWQSLDAHADVVRDNPKGLLVIGGGSHDLLREGRLEKAPHFFALKTLTWLPRAVVVRKLLG